MKRLISLLTLLVALSVNAQTIHWITFIDDSYDIINCNNRIDTISFGESAHNMLYGRFIQIVSPVLLNKGYKISISDPFRQSITPDSFKKAIEKLHCDQNDIIMFYYIGHGAHGTDDINPYPQLTLGSNSERMYIPLQWVHNQLKAKNPALLVSICMCSNDSCSVSSKKKPMFIIDDVNKIKEPTFKVNYGIEYLTAAEKQTITDFFKGCKGDIILSSASPGQHSYACYTPYGFTDLFSAMFVSRFENDSSEGTLNWATLLNNVKELVHDSSHGKQTPIFECNITSKDNEPVKSQKESKLSDPSSYGLRESIMENGKRIIALLNDYISFMADKNNSLQDRLDCKNRALSLFIANGNSYNVDGVTKQGVILETISPYRHSPIRRLVRDYFDDVINYNYSNVEIESSSIIEISDLERIDDNTYICIASYVQTFIGYRDGVPVYKDRTRKNVIIKLASEDVKDSTEYILKLGDITVVETKRL